MLLTDEVLAWIGRTASYRAAEPLGQASIRYFALATGDDPARWGHVAPPTLVCETCQVYGGQGRHPRTGYLGHSWDLPFPESTRLLRGGNDYTFLRPVTADDVLSVEWALVELVEKPNFVVSVAEAVYSNQFGVRLALNRETSLHQPVPGGGQPASTSASAGAGTGAGRSASSSAAAASAASASATARAAARAGLGGGSDGERNGELADLVQPLDEVDLMAYGAATWDWHRLHYDVGYCRSIGLDGPIVDGQMLGALMARQVRGWAGADGTLQRLWFRNTAMVRPGQVVWVEGRVARSDGPLATVDQRVWADERVVASGGAEVLLR